LRPCRQGNSREIFLIPDTEPFKINNLGVLFPDNGRESLFPAGRFGRELAGNCEVWRTLSTLRHVSDMFFDREKNQAG